MLRVLVALLVVMASCMRSGMEARVPGGDPTASGDSTTSGDSDNGGDSDFEPPAGCDSASTFDEVGGGVPGDPYVICTADQLLDIARGCNETQSVACGALFRQEGDITIPAPTNFPPIGSSTNPFVGGYNGAGFYIANLFVDEPGTDFVGMFRTIDGASIRRVHLRAARVVGQHSTGALVGRMDNAASIDDCSSSGFVSGDTAVGGLVGYNYHGAIDLSSSSATAGGVERVGGLVGENNGGDIFGSFAAGDVSGTVTIGGLVGYQYDGATIDACYAEGQVEGDESVGGLVGESATTNNLLEHSYAVGLVVGAITVGGLVAYEDGGTQISSFWGFDPGLPDFGTGQATSGGASVGGAEPRTEAQLESQSNYVGWDFTNIWVIDEGNDYPRHR